jgi:two-component system nitrogen regulation sensor histidine kinase NtrY
LWTELKAGAAGSRLHVRLVGMFAAIAVIPAILVAIFAAVSLNLGIEAWFSERVQTALNNSVSVADAYVEEHKQVIRGDILAIRPQSPGRFAERSRCGSSEILNRKRRSGLRLYASIEGTDLAAPNCYMPDQTRHARASPRRTRMSAISLFPMSSCSPRTTRTPCRRL